jgi:hypothetical protein
MEQAYPDLKGFSPSWADVKCSAKLFDGPLIEMEDIAALNWSDAVEEGVHKRGGRPHKRTTGEYSCEASATLYRSGHRKLVRNLATIAPKRGNQTLVSLVIFNFTVKYTPPWEEDDIYITAILGCRLVGRNAQAGEGSDAGKLELNLKPMQVAEIEDGQEIVLL